MTDGGYVAQPGDSRSLATHWAIAQGRNLSVSGLPSLVPSPGTSAGYIDIRNLETGWIGHFTVTTLDVGAGIGFSVGKESGEWAYFETQHALSLQDFEGGVRMYSMGLFTKTLVSGIHLPVDIAHDSLWGDLHFNSVDISDTSNSASLGVNWGIGELSLDSVEAGSPQPGLFDDVRDQMREIEFGPPHFDMTTDAASRQTNLETDANANQAGHYDMRQDIPVVPHDMTVDAASRQTNLETDANAGHYDMRQDLFDPSQSGPVEVQSGDPSASQVSHGTSTLVFDPAQSVADGVGDASAAPATEWGNDADLTSTATDPGGQPDPSDYVDTGDQSGGE